MRQSIVEQDWEQASAIANALRRLIESGGGSPTLIAHVVNISIINFISEEFRMLARENDLPVDVLRSMRESLERALAANTRLQGSMILGEKYFTMEVYESIRSEMTLKERMQSMFKNDGYSVGAAAKAYTIAGTYWNASRSSREAMEATGSWSRNEFIQYTIGLFVRIRTHTDVMAHELYVSLAVLDLEILHDESGEYPEELPKEMIERIPAGIRFGDGMIYVVSDDRQSYELLMTPEFPEKWREQSNGRFRLKREPLSQEDLGLLESAAKTLKAEGFEEPPVQD